MAQFRSKRILLWFMLVMNAEGTSGDTADVLHVYWLELDMGEREEGRGVSNIQWPHIWWLV